MLPADGEASDQFALGLALDGDTAVVGARFDDDHRGSAYVFRFGPGDDGEDVPAVGGFGTVLLLLTVLTGIYVVRRWVKI